MRDRSVVLLVQPDPVLRSQIAAALRQAGLDVAEAGCGAEAVAIAANTPPSHAVVDPTLPDIDSYELIARLKEISPDLSELKYFRKAVKAVPFWERTREEKLEALLNVGEHLWCSRNTAMACSSMISTVLPLMFSQEGFIAKREQSIELLAARSERPHSEFSIYAETAFAVWDDLGEDRPFAIPDAVVFPIPLEPGVSFVFVVQGVDDALGAVEDPLIERLGKTIAGSFFRIYHHENLHHSYDINAAELERFHDTGQAVADARDPWESADKMLYNIRQLAKASECMLFARNADTMRIVASTNNNLKVPIGTSLHQDDTVAWSVLESQEPLFISDLRNDGLKLDRLAAAKANINSALYMPLIYSGRKLGVLVIGFDNQIDKNFLEVAGNSLNALAAQAALVVDGMRLLEQVQVRVESLLEASANQLASAVANARLYREVDTERRKLQSLFAAVPDSIFVYDINSNMLAMNPAARKLYGVPQDQEKLGNWSDYEDFGVMCTLDGIPVERSRYPGARFLRGETVCAEEYMFRRPDGTELFFSISGAPIYDESGCVTAAVDIARDITAEINARCRLIKITNEVEERAALIESNKQRLEAIFGAIPGAIFVCDRNGKVVMTNRIGETIMADEFDNRLDAFNSEKRVVICKPDGTPYAGHEIPIARSITSGEYVWAEQMIVTLPSGKTIALLANSAPIYAQDGDICGGVTILQDISELQRAYDRLSESLDHEQKVVERLQTAFLPRDLPKVEGFEVCSRYKWALEKARLGGDLYDLFSLPDGSMGIVMADVSGKGLEAAVYTAMTKYMLYAYALEDPSPESVVQRLNQALCVGLPSNYFVTLIYGILNTSERKLSYVNAGHEQPLLIEKSTGIISQLNVTGRALGLLPESVFTAHEVTMREGDTLFLYTDGLTDFLTNSGDSLELEGLLAIISEMTDLSAADMMWGLWDALHRMGAERFRDDIAVLCLKAV